MKNLIIDNGFLDRKLSRETLLAFIEELEAIGTELKLDGETEAMRQEAIARAYTLWAGMVSLNR
jgi:hypothetical protein